MFMVITLLIWCCARLDTALLPAASPLNDKSATSATANRCHSRDRSSASATSSPARCPQLGKSIPSSGKSSLVASPLSDSSRRRRVADHRNSPRHATACGLRGSVGGLGSTSGQSAAANGHSARTDGVQSESSSLDTRLERATSAERSGIPAETFAAVHAVRHLAVPAESPSRRRSDRRDCDMQSNDVSNGNVDQLVSHPATEAAADDNGTGEDGVKSGCQLCLSPVSTDAKSTSQVDAVRRVLELS